MVKRGTDNPHLRALIIGLESAAKTAKTPAYARVAQLLKRPTRTRAKVNVYRLDKHAAAGETVVVPGKVLALGKPTKKYTVAAWEYSAPAKKTLQAAGCTTLTLGELLVKNPSGKGIKIIV